MAEHAPSSEYVPSCRAIDPDEWFVCTLPRAHQGPHEAHGSLPADRFIKAWPKAATSTSGDAS